MNRGMHLRLLSLFVALLIALTTVPALASDESAPEEIPDESIVEFIPAEQVDADIDEAAELSLDDDEEIIAAEPAFWEEAAMEGESGETPTEVDNGETSTDDTPTSEPASEVTEAPTPTPQPTPDPSKRVFGSTAAVNGETWQGIDLSRAAGFTGKLASVSGTLTLNGVTIEGQPARSVNLLDYFELTPGASIAILDGAPLTLNLGALSLNRGSGQTLKAYYNGSAVKAGKVKWSTSSKKLAKISKKGKVSAKARGTAVVTASYKGEKAVCYLDITGIVQPKSVSFKKKKLTLGLNRTATLKTKLKPANVDDPTLSWASSNPGVVSVDQSGNVTGLSVGKATIYVSTVNGKTAKCKVTVKAKTPKSVCFQTLYVTLHPGETYQCGVDVKPASASYPQLAFASSDTAVATVNENGVITAVGLGTATITAASALNPKIANTCKVCVIQQGAAQLEGLIIGINPGHQSKAIKKRYPMAPGSHSYGPGVKVGATGCHTHQTEYNVVLKVGLKLKRILEEHGATVVITRTSNDVMLTNIDRAKMLNEAGVDAALQLHCNSCSNPSKTGSSSYYRPNGEWKDENKALAIQLSKYMSKATGFANRGINPYTDYMSLNWTTTPSVLLEMGYLSNSSDDKKLSQDAFQEKLALGIYQGLCAYFGR